MIHGFIPKCSADFSPLLWVLFVVDSNIFWFTCWTWTRSCENFLSDLLLVKFSKSPCSSIIIVIIRALMCCVQCGVIQTHLDFLTSPLLVCLWLMFSSNSFQVNILMFVCFISSEHVEKRQKYDFSTCGKKKVPKMFPLHQFFKLGSRQVLHETFYSTCEKSAAHFHL